MRPRFVATIGVLAGLVSGLSGCIPAQGAICRTYEEHYAYLRRIPVGANELEALAKASSEYPPDGKDIWLQSSEQQMFLCRVRTGCKRGSCEAVRFEFAKTSAQWSLVDVTIHEIVVTR
jgi:hypothetical protein